MSNKVGLPFLCDNVEYLSQKTTTNFLFVTSVITIKETHHMNNLMVSTGLNKIKHFDQLVNCLSALFP